MQCHEPASHAGETLWRTLLLAEGVRHTGLHYEPSAHFAVS